MYILILSVHINGTIAFIMLCSHHHYSLSIIETPQTETLHPLSNNSPFLLPQPRVPSRLLCVSVLDGSCKWTHTASASSAIFAASRSWSTLFLYRHPHAGPLGPCHSFLLVHHWGCTLHGPFLLPLNQPELSLSGSFGLKCSFCTTWLLCMRLFVQGSSPAPLPCWSSSS